MVDCGDDYKKYAEVCEESALTKEEADQEIAYCKRAINSLDSRKYNLLPLTADFETHIERENGEIVAQSRLIGHDVTEVASYWANTAEKDFGITDPVILDAIKYHTTGRKKMSWLEKLVFVSDKIEPTRPYDSSDLIKAMYDDFEQGFITVLKANREFLISKDKMVDNRFTADCFKYYLGL